MLPENLKIAKCCSTCLYTNDKPKLQPDTHASHYTVAKTERWCTLHQCPTVREGVCDDHEPIDKKGGAPAVKRARKQISRLNAINAFKEKIRNNGGEIVTDRHAYRVVDGRVVYYYGGNTNGSYYQLSCKSNSHDNALELKK